MPLPKNFKPKKSRLKGKRYKGKRRNEIAFPLGGIGTGSVSLSGFGGLRDWAIHNRPNFDGPMPYTFPAIWARAGKEAPVCRVLRAPAPPPYAGLGGGDPHDCGEGFPHMDNCVFRGAFPFAEIDFACEALPVKVSLEAYSPFIPGDPDASGYPLAVLRYTLVNTSALPVSAVIAWNMLNPVGGLGSAGRDPVLGRVEQGFGGNANHAAARDGLRGVEFGSAKWPRDHPRYGSAALLSPDPDVITGKYWLRAPWFAPRHDFWDRFSASGALPDYAYPASEEGQTTPGAVGVRLRLAPGASGAATFYIAWHFGNFEKYWHCAGESPAPGGCCPAAPKHPVWKNHYAARFASAVDAAAHFHARERDLYARTRAFRDALHASTLPAAALDAVSANLAILRTGSCLRLEDGSFYTFEGVAPMGGCCEGSCTHVLNYAQAAAFLFPSLERSLRETDYRYNLKPGGALGFRQQLPLGAPPLDFMPAADGQFGGIIKLYRDWKISGDDAWLARIWPEAKRALEHAWTAWDPERTGVLRGAQHNTYDIEFHGENTMTSSFYLGALLAGAEMAAAAGDTESAEAYREIHARGAAWIDANLFNGAYYEQHPAPDQPDVHQYGRGCLADQVHGAWLTELAGLGCPMDPAKVWKALQAIVRYNFKPRLGGHANAQRVYAVQDEGGLLNCSWPRGERPAVPFVYSDEVWPGIEYQVAAHCIHAGLVNEGLALVEAVRARFDGHRRNPWNEFECGFFYVRSLASYGLLIALSGFRCDRGAGIIGFAPRIQPGKFSCLWSIQGAWGRFEQRKRRARVSVSEGALALNRVDLPLLDIAGSARVRCGARTLTAPVDELGSVILPETVQVAAGETLDIGGAK